MSEGASLFERLQQHNHGNQVLKQPVFTIDDSESEIDDTTVEKSSKFFSADVFTKVQPRFKSLKEVLARVNNDKVESVDNFELSHVSSKKSNSFTQHQEEVCVTKSDSLLKNIKESRVVDCSVNSLHASESKILKRKRLTAEERQVKNILFFNMSNHHFQLLNK